LTYRDFHKRQHQEKLIPKAITKLLAGKKVPIHGNGTYVRNWIHVEDNIDGILRVIDQGALNEVYHIASNEEYSVNDVVNKICTVLNLNTISFTDYSSDRAGADFRYALNFEKITKLGWVPQRTLDQSLLEIIDFYRKK